MHFLHLSILFLFFLTSHVESATVTTSMTIIDPIALDEVVLFDEEAVKYNLVFITSKKGTKKIELEDGEELINIKHDGKDYRCILPAPISPEEFENIRQVPSKEQLEDVEAAKELLEPLEGICMKKVEGWWTYEYCYGQQVRQYHNEGKRIAAEFSLGKHVSKQVRKSAQRRTVQELVSSDTSAESKAKEKPQEKSEYIGKDNETGEYYFGTVMKEGTYCDVTDSSRQVEVRHFCTLKETTSFSDFKEPSSCVYVIDVHTPLLCSNPVFTPRTIPVNDIRCITEFSARSSTSQTAGTILLDNVVINGEPVTILDNGRDTSIQFFFGEELTDQASMSVSPASRSDAAKKSTTRSLPTSATSSIGGSQGRRASKQPTSSDTDTIRGNHKRALHKPEPKRNNGRS